MVSSEGGEGNPIVSRLCATCSSQQPLGQSIPISQMETPRLRGVKLLLQGLSLDAAHGVLEPLHFFLWGFPLTKLCAAGHQLLPLGTVPLTPMAEGRMGKEGGSLKLRDCLLTHFSHDL